MQSRRCRLPDRAPPSPTSPTSPRWTGVALADREGGAARPRHPVRARRSRGRLVADGARHVGAARGARSGPTCCGPRPRPSRPVPCSPRSANGSVTPSIGRFELIGHARGGIATHRGCSTCTVATYRGRPQVMRDVGSTEDDRADTTTSSTAPTGPTAGKVGDRLRAIRRQKRLSLQDVEASSDQEFKASVLGAYERGERAISVPRLQRLARFYRVPVDQLLPGDDGPDFGPARRRRSSSTSPSAVSLEPHRTVTHRPHRLERPRRHRRRDARPLPRG